MPNTKQWLAVYVALLIGGIASAMTHFTDYIAILLVALALTGVALYKTTKELHEYQSKHYRDPVKR